MVACAGGECPKVTADGVGNLQLDPGAGGKVFAADTELTGVEARLASLEATVGTQQDELDTAADERAALRGQVSVLTRAIACATRGVAALDANQPVIPCSSAQCGLFGDWLTTKYGSAPDAPVEAVTELAGTLGGIAQWECQGDYVMAPTDTGLAMCSPADSQWSIVGNATCLPRGAKLDKAMITATITPKGGHGAYPPEKCLNDNYDDFCHSAALCGGIPASAVCPSENDDVSLNLLFDRLVDVTFVKVTSRRNYGFRTFPAIIEYQPEGARDENKWITCAHFPIPATRKEREAPLEATCNAKGIRHLRFTEMCARMPAPPERPRLTRRLHPTAAMFKSVPTGAASSTSRKSTSGVPSRTRPFRSTAGSHPSR